jgi:hypothetical protein
MIEKVAEFIYDNLIEHDFGDTSWENCKLHAEKKHVAAECIAHATDLIRLLELDKIRELVEWTISENDNVGIAKLLQKILSILSDIDGEGEQRGLCGKYKIEKRDGSTDPNAEYFVLRIDKDPHARFAAYAYADVCEKDNSLLADDLRNWCDKHEELAQKQPAKPLREGITDILREICYDRKQHFDDYADRILAELEGE